MKSYWIKAEKGKTVFERYDVPKPQPKRGEIVVRVCAASLNRGELLAAIKHYQTKEAKPAGGDGAGVVHAVGAGVSEFKNGDEVMFRARGSFSEYVAVVAAQAISKPACLSWEHAAAVPLVFVTAYESICRYGKLKKGNWLLVAGASSGVGVACVQAAKYLGAKVIGTSSSRDKIKTLETIGLDIGIRSSGKQFLDRVLKATEGKGVNVAVNLVGGTAFPECLASLANQGKIAIVGYLDGMLKSEIDLARVHRMRLQIFGLSNACMSAANRKKAMLGFKRTILPGFVNGNIVPVVDRVFPFENLPEAKVYVETNSQIGKVVVSLR